MGGAGGGGDSLQQMMAQSQQMMQQNPEMLQQMMESPMVQQMMENPDVMRSIMQMNPQTRQLMEEHPEIARMLEDPETLRQSARMASNPSLMREMMRNQDTAMGRLDAMPGGHAALARMHRDVVDPMQNAMTASGDSNTSINRYSEDAQGHRNTAPLSNPWGPSQPAAQPIPSATQATPPAAGRPVDPMQQLMQMQSGGANPMAQMMQPGGANPMEQMMQNPQMMQQMMQNPQMQQMTQQMMQNPEMMQQMMQMSAHMFGQQAGGVHGADGTTQPPNPMANMMQQMMQNPQMMQQAMQRSQQMFGQQGSAGMPGMFGQYPMGQPPMFEAPPAQTGAVMDEAAVAAAASNPMIRARFAQQLDAMIAMGFSDEQRCLQVLIQCDGNVDRALDKMFAQN
jgi:ubiquilin